MQVTTIPTSIIATDGETVPIEAFVDNIDLTILEPWDIYNGSGSILTFSNSFIASWVSGVMEADTTLTSRESEPVELSYLCTPSNPQGNVGCGVGFNLGDARAFSAIYVNNPAIHQIDLYWGFDLQETFSLALGGLEEWSCVSNYNGVDTLTVELVIGLITYNRIYTVSTMDGKASLYTYVDNVDIDVTSVAFKVVPAISWEKDTGPGYEQVSTDNPYNYPAVIEDNDGSLRAKAVLGEFLKWGVGEIPFDGGDWSDSVGTGQIITPDYVTCPDIGPTSCRVHAPAVDISRKSIITARSTYNSGGYSYHYFLANDDGTERILIASLGATYSAYLRSGGSEAIIGLGVTLVAGDIISVVISFNATHVVVNIVITRGGGSVVYDNTLNHPWDDADFVGTHPEYGGFFCSVTMDSYSVDFVQTTYSDPVPLTISPAFIGDLRLESRKTVRRPLGKVKITWTDPLIDVSLNMETSESNRISYAEQVADLVSDVPHKWFHTNDTDVILDGSFYSMPSTLKDARKSQVGWWGTQNSGFLGEFPDLNKPTLTVSFTKRLVEGFTITGDNALYEYPVDFTVTVFLNIGGSYAPIEQMQVVGNTEMTYSAKFLTAHSTAVRLQLEISKWSHPGKIVKIVEFYSNITEIYESDDILLLNILQEFESSEGTLPVGNISCNEMDLTLQNITDMFFSENTDSNIHTMIKRNRKIEPFLGFQYSSGQTEFVAKGLYWSGDWMVSDNNTGASTSARDRFELLRKKEFPWDTVFTEILSDVSLKTLFEDVLNSVFDYMYDFFYDISDLDDTYIVPHFNPEFFKGKSYFDVIKELAAASLAYAFMDLPTSEELEINGALNKDILRVLKVESVFPTNLIPALAINVTKDDFTEKMQPADTESMANSITVTYKAFEIDPEDPEKWIDEELTASAQDEDSIIEYGVMDYRYDSNDLIQTESHAQTIADSLLVSFKVSNRNIELQTFGDVTLELANQISVPEYQKNGIDKRGVFAITTLNSQYDGSLRISISGRKLKEDRSQIEYRMLQDTDSAVVKWQDTDGATDKYQDTGV